MSIQTRIKQRIGTLADWSSSDIVLLSGELAVVQCGNQTRFKVGNGTSSFTQLPFVDQNLLCTYHVAANSIAQGIHADSVPYGLAAGAYLSAGADFSQALGFDAKTLSSDTYSFVWNGDDSRAIGSYYQSHGKGTFSINPISGLNGIYIGEQTLGSLLQTYIEIEHDDLVQLRDTSALVPGAKYRITDYRATANGYMEETAISAPFDIIVEADSCCKLNENARAIRHAGDNYFPATTKFEAWQLQYCIDNDTSRFVWANTENGKGVVHRLIDEFQNDVPYDFKGLKFVRNGNYYFTFDDGSGNDASLDASAHYVFLNKIGPCIDDLQYLNDIVFLGDCCYSNVFSLCCYEITLSGSCIENTFGNMCGDIKLGSNCQSNKFGQYCYGDVFGSYCQSIKLGDNCSNIKLGANAHVTSSNAKSYCRFIKIASGNTNIVLNPTGTTSNSSFYQNIEIKPGVNVGSSYKTITDPNVGQTFTTTYQPADSQVIAV